jgi:IclR family transcriptional regulator, pca regulon regulatory protein
MSDGDIKRLEKRHPRYSASLDSGLAILQSFTGERPLLGIADIADELGMSRSTAHRYVITLVQLGFLEQPLRASRKYALGTNGYPIARAMLDCHPLCVNARPHLHELRRQVSFTVTVAILENGAVRVLERLPGYRGHARLGLTIGAASRLPMYCTGLGKAMLANLPESESRAIVRGLELDREGPNTITRKNELNRELTQIRDVGFAVENEELVPGVLSLAAPIRAAGELLGAVDVSAPTSLIDRKALIEKCGPHLLAASERISSALNTNQSEEHANDDRSSDS